MDITEFYLDKLMGIILLNMPTLKVLLRMEIYRLHLQAHILLTGNPALTGMFPKVVTLLTLYQSAMLHQLKADIYPVFS